MGGGNRAKGERERVGTLNRKQMASIGARNTEKHRKKKIKKNPALLLIRPNTFWRRQRKGMGWNSVGRATSGWAYRRSAEECRCSLWDSRKGKGKKCFTNRASLGIQSTSSVLGRLFRVGPSRPSPDGTRREAWKSGESSRGAVRFGGIFVSANVCPYLTF